MERGAQSNLVVAKTGWPTHTRQAPEVTLWEAEESEAKTGG